MVSGQHCWVRGGRPCPSNTALGAGRPAGRGQGRVYGRPVGSTRETATAVPMRLLTAFTALGITCPRAAVCRVWTRRVAPSASARTACDSARPEPPAWTRALPARGGVAVIQAANAARPASTGPAGPHAARSIACWVDRIALLGDLACCWVAVGVMSITFAVEGANCHAFGGANTAVGLGVTHPNDCFPTPTTTPTYTTGPGGRRR
jgi:hypothetical protein